MSSSVHKACKFLTEIELDCMYAVFSSFGLTPMLLRVCSFMYLLLLLLLLLLLWLLARKKRLSM